MSDKPHLVMKITDNSCGADTARTLRFDTSSSLALSVLITDADEDPANPDHGRQVDLTRTQVRQLRDYLNEVLV